ncbi:MAG: hypothetical protein ACXWVT_13260 [Burkholderiaceae bacterium]
MAFHKHGIYSFQVDVQRMVVIGGHNFVADVIALRRHAHNGAAESLEVPLIDEQYGETAQDAEGLAAKAMCGWLDAHFSRVGNFPLRFAPRAEEPGRAGQ